jgi:hypothetical protein
MIHANFNIVIVVYLLDANIGTPLMFAPVPVSSPLILTELIKHKNTTTYDVGNLGPCLRHAHKIWWGYTC